MFFLGSFRTKMCFICSRDEWDQAIGWFKGGRRQYIIPRRWGNEIDNTFVITDCYDDESIVKIRFRNKKDEIEIPETNEATYLFIATLAFFTDTNIELTTAGFYNPGCDNPVEPEFNFFKIDKDIAKDYISGFETTLCATNGNQFQPEEDDELSNKVQGYLEFFLENCAK